MKIYAIVDSASWCWATTAREVSSHLPQHEFIITSRPREKEAATCDLIWMRGYPYLFPHLHDLGVPVVWTFASGGARADELLERCRPFIPGAAAIICLNRAMRARLEQAGATRTWVIPNGVDCQRFSPAPGGYPDPVLDGFRVGMAANLNAERFVNKGAESTVAACRNSRRELLLATKPRPGKPSPALEYDIGRVEHADMPDFLRRLSVYCQPSIAEGCSNSIMEAMACGLPCIICRESGYHGEACQDGRDREDGQVLFVRPGSVFDLEQALAWLHDNPIAAGRISRNAREFAKRHSWPEIASHYGNVFECAGERAREFDLVTVACGEYAAAFEQFLPGWLANSGARSITVISDAQFGNLPVRVHHRHLQNKARSWLSGVMAKADALSVHLETCADGTRLVLLDADCAVLKDLRPFAEGTADLTLTRFSIDPARHPRCAGTCSSGAFALTVNPRTRAFVRLWDLVQQAYALVGHGTRPGKVACDQYALTDLARGKACGVSIRAADERIWNSAPDRSDDAWLADIHARRPAVVHFKGGRWRNRDLVARIISSGNNESEARR